MSWRRVSIGALPWLVSFSLLSAAGLNGVFSKSQIDSGAGVYARKCAMCHGEHLDGGDHAPSLKDDSFWGEWNGKPARSLYSRIISTMPPDDPGTIPEKDVIDVLAYIVTLNGAAPGSNPVPHATDLNTITLERPR